tara:strand:- start:259 stop:567 length:309 start_codon:yes stop_codon:yes gene_type:complete
LYPDDGLFPGVRDPLPLQQTVPTRSLRQGDTIIIGEVTHCATMPDANSRTRYPMDCTISTIEGRQSWLLNRMEVLYSPPNAKSQAIETLSVNAHVIAARYFV